MVRFETVSHGQNINIFNYTTTHPQYVSKISKIYGRILHIDIYSVLCLQYASIGI